MKSIQKLLITVVMSIGLNGTIVLAEEAQQSTAKASTEVQIKELDQKIKSIEAQIDELEKSDDPDYDKIDELQNQLLAAQKEKTSKLSEITVKQREIIEFKQKELLKSYENINKTLGSIKETLSSGNDKK